ncbi:MAG: hypothetical protein AAB860_00745 [Patescibacteria group bacterium]
MDPASPILPVQPVVSPLISTVIPTSKFKTHIFVWIVVGIVILGVGITGGLFLGKKLYPIPQILPTPSPISQATPTPDPTANWKTYTNDTYGFSFQYPPELLLSVNCTVFAMGNFLTCLQSSDFSYLVSDPDKKQPETSKTVTISEGFGLFVKKDITDYPYDISVLQEDYKRSHSNVSVTTTNTTPILKVSSNNNPGNVHWIMIHNKNVYSVLSPFNTQDYPVIDQILSTFKFIDAIPEKTEGDFCGGFAGVICPDEFRCKYDGDYPDAAGKCVKKILF